MSDENKKIKEKSIGVEKANTEVIKKKSISKKAGASEQQEEKRLATEKNPTIEAILNGLFRFETIEQARDRLVAVEKHFIISSKLPKDEEDSLKLWIRGYKIDKDEEKKGFLGNYAKLSIEELKDKKYTISAEKQRIGLKYHPQRKREKKKHPDWGHPCLRIVKKKHVFETIEETQNLLNQLHEDFPEVTIPAVNKLFIIIYSKAMKPPVTKYVLEIKAAKEGGFYVDYALNTYQKKKVPEVKKNQEGDESSEGGQEPLGKGYFASMVALKRNSKDQIKELREKKKQEDNQS